MAISHATLAKLAEFDTPTICNVIELFDVRPHNMDYMNGRIHCNFPALPPMVGFAATASFRANAPSEDAEAYRKLTAQIEQFSQLSGPAVVVFQDLDDPPIAATFGEVMCSAYRAFGAASLVTNGGGRDLEQIRRLDFPVFTGSTIVSHGYHHILDLGIPVNVGGLTISQGDLLHGDANGITKVPIDIAADVADAAKEFLAGERIMLDYLQGAGDKTLSGFAERQRDFGAIVHALRRRITSRTRPNGGLKIDGRPDLQRANQDGSIADSKPAS